ncbi:TetR/AcrR family transcriptional regulator [Oceanobacter kriegii]|uniref:TetR/AcrR family transcriptional regulator n=1 Tax=Oceanobacter kriegii TaxID=64972 RepID=UPI00146DFD8F|nr:TetR/AcrR family transcriptional regulator [Oceanobacter kriegii]
MKTEADFILSTLEAFSIPLPKQQRSLESFGRILLATQEVIAEYGFARASTVEIAKRADLSQGGLFKRFPSKDTLVAAMVFYTEAKARSAALQSLEQNVLNASIHTRADRIVRDYWQFIQTSEFKAVDAVWHEISVNPQLRMAMTPVFEFNHRSGDLTVYFPEFENTRFIQMLSQTFYAGIEYISFNHSVGVEQNVDEKLSMLSDMLSRELERLQSTQSSSA